MFQPSRNIGRELLIADVRHSIVGFDHQALRYIIRMKSGAMMTALEDSVTFDARGQLVLSDTSSLRPIQTYSELANRKIQRWLTDPYTEQRPYLPVVRDIDDNKCEVVDVDTAVPTLDQARRIISLQPKADKRRWCVLHMFYRSGRPTYEVIE